MIKNKLKILDIGHSNFNLEKALLMLETEISKSIFDDDCKAVKVITGHGSGVLKETVQNWCEEQKGRFREVIFGKDYNMFNDKASDMRSECGIRTDLDFGRNNSGVIYIWFW